MKSFNTLFALAALTCTAALAEAPSTAPAGANGICKDGTYSMSAEKSGACAGHKGVKKWYDAASAKKEKAAPMAKTPVAPMNKTTASAPAPTVASAPAPMAPKAATPARVPSGPAAVAAAGGGAGLVWANENTKVYHCNGDKWYGKTEHGAYMSEADAKSKGFHGDHNKSCS